MKTQKTNKGITLIALVITIIVMLILVGVTISMAVNGGLFDYAKKASSEMQNERDKEQQLADLAAGMTVDELIDKYKGESEGEDIVGMDGEIYSALYKETKEYKDKNGKTAMIPKGFSVGKSDGINTIDGGLVIQDAKGNQFVWIPVNYTASGTKDENGLDTGFTDTFKRSNMDDEFYSEPYAKGYTNPDGTTEADDYYDMMKSVQKNKGFYIGRFEAGTTVARTYYDKDDTSITDEQRTSPLVVKRDAYPYNYVGWGVNMHDYVSNVISSRYEMDENDNDVKIVTDQGKGAVYLSKHLLDGQSTGATSTLCYGVQWDAMFKFFKKEAETVGTDWGNCSINSLKITRTSAKYYADDQWNSVTETGTSCGKLLTTGADDSFALKNIYDVAGNCQELTMESSSDLFRIERGTSYMNFSIGDLSKTQDSATPNGCWDFLSFRPVLYITIV